MKEKSPQKSLTMDEFICILAKIHIHVFAFKRLFQQLTEGLESLLFYWEGSQLNAHVSGRCREMAVNGSDGGGSERWCLGSGGGSSVGVQQREELPASL